MIINKLQVTQEENQIAQQFTVSGHISVQTSENMKGSAPMDVTRIICNELMKIHYGISVQDLKEAFPEKFL